MYQFRLTHSLGVLALVFSGCFETENSQTSSAVEQSNQLGNAENNASGRSTDRERPPSDTDRDPWDGEEPPPSDPEFCRDLMVQAEQCAADHQLICAPELDAIEQCMVQAMAPCDAARQAFDQCLADGQDPATCHALLPDEEACYIDAQAQCAPLEANLEACFRPCTDLRQDFFTHCHEPHPEPPPGHEDPYCEDLYLAHEQCVTDLEIVCQPLIDAATQCHDQAYQTCEPLRIDFEQCLDSNPQDPAICEARFADFMHCREQMSDQCAQFEYDAELCFDSCNDIREEIEGYCQPEPPVGNSACDHLTQALVLCYEEGRPGCELIEQALEVVCVPDGHPCPPDEEPRPLPGEERPWPGDEGQDRPDGDGGEERPSPDRGEFPGRG